MSVSHKREHSRRRITLDVMCSACSGTGLYIGMGEKGGAAVVCRTCDGTGKDTLTYVPFTARNRTPRSVKSVHVARGYFIEHGHPKSAGGLPVNAWQPGTAVPADEQMYCPYLYTGQKWCAQPVVSKYTNRLEAPLLAGDDIKNCRHWDDKAECWRLFHANAPENARRQVS
jgi:hypothetical protein